MSSANDNPFVNALAEELNAIAADGHVRRYRAGEVIFSAGQEGDGFFVVESGQVSISAAAQRGNPPRILATIGPGDFFGEMAIVDDAPRSATATAETDTTTVFLRRDTLLKLLERRPHLALYIIREFSIRMRALNQKYLDEILQAERLAGIGRLAGTIVHDFKNPLTVIGLASEMLASTDLPPAARASARQRIAQQVERMSNLLQELIEFSRPSGARPNVKPTDFAAFVRTLLQDLQPELAERKVTLELVQPPPSVVVALDPPRITRLFCNLFNNAADEMRGGGRILLRFAVTGGDLQVEVEDTGPGIAPEIAQSLFQPFATHGKEHGTGLGLTICRKIVEDHHGRISARSEPGRGATFTFTLPLAR